MKSIFVTELENITQCILSVRLGASQIFVSDDYAWKHDSTETVVTAIIKCLSEMYFLFCYPAWKCFVVYIISNKCTANIFVWWSALKTFHGGYWLPIYLLYKYHTLEWKYFLFHRLAWKHFAVFLSGKPVRLKNMIWRKQKFLIFQM